MFPMVVLTGLGLFSYFFLAYVLNFYYLANDSRYTVNIIMKGLIVSILFIFAQIIGSVILFDFSFWRVNLLLFLFLTPIAILIWRRLFTFAFKFISTTKKVLYIHDGYISSDWEKYVEIINGKGINTFYNVVDVIDISDKNQLQEDELKNINNEIDSWILDINTAESTS